MTPDSAPARPGRMLEFKVFPTFRKELVVLTGITGVSLVLKLEAEVLPVDEFGRVEHRFAKGDNVTLVATVTDPSVHALNVDRGKNVSVMKNHSASHGRKVAKTKIRIQLESAPRPRARVLLTEYPHNTMRFIRLEPDGNFEFFEAALVAQNGSFYLTWQKQYEGRLYERDGAVASHRFSNWPQLLRVLGDIIDPATLAPLPDEAPETEPDLSGLRPRSGLVAWYNLASGRGAIHTPESDDKAALVRWTQIPPREGGLRYVLPGETVGYAELRDPMETKGRPTAFRKEARNVWPFAMMAGVS